MMSLIQDIGACLLVDNDTQTKPKFKRGDLVFLKADRKVPISERQMYEVQDKAFYYDLPRPSYIPVKKYDPTQVHYYHQWFVVSENDIEHVPDWLTVLDNLKENPPPMPDDSFCSSTTSCFLTANELANALCILMDNGGMTYRQALKSLSKAMKRVTSK